MPSDRASDTGPGAGPEAGLAGCLIDGFGLRRPVAVPLDAGMNSRTWWIHEDGAEQASYVVKWVPGHRADELRSGVRAAEVASRGGLPTGAAVVGVDGRRVLDHGGGALVLLDRVAGVELTGDSAADDERIGRTLAAAHHATLGARLPASGTGWPWLDPDRAPLADHPDLADRIAEVLRDLRALPPLVDGICHGDPAPEAFLLAEDGTIGLIDWAGAATAPLLYDVASAAMYLGGHASAGSMLTAYADAGGPATGDLAHLPVMLDVRWSVQAIYFAGRIAADDLTGLTSAAGNAKGLDDARRQLLGG